MEFGKASLPAFASDNPRSSLWRTWPPSGAEGSAAYSGTWPSSGTTRAGRAYEQVTLARPTAESEPLSWPTDRKRQAYSPLPTPVANDGNGGQPVAKRRAGGHQVDLSDLVISLWPLPPSNPDQREQEQAA